MYGYACKQNLSNWRSEYGMLSVTNNGGTFILTMIKINVEMSLSFIFISSDRKSMDKYYEPRKSSSLA